MHIFQTCMELCPVDRPYLTKDRICHGSDPVAAASKKLQTLFFCVVIIVRLH